MAIANLDDWQKILAYRSFEGTQNLNNMFHVAVVAADSVRGTIGFQDEAFVKTFSLAKVVDKVTIEYPLWLQS